MMISPWHHVATMPLARERRRRFRSQEPHLRVGHIDTTFWNHRPNRRNKSFKTRTSIVITILLPIWDYRMLCFFCHPYRHLHSLPKNFFFQKKTISKINFLNYNITPPTNTMILPQHHFYNHIIWPPITTHRALKETKPHNFVSKEARSQTGSITNNKHMCQYMSNLLALTLDD